MVLVIAFGAGVLVGIVVGIMFCLVVGRWARGERLRVLAALEERLRLWDEANPEGGRP
jgi:hypothetical protein